MNHQVDLVRLESTAHDYVGVVHELLGFYLDATHGFLKNRETIDKGQRYAIEKNLLGSWASIEYMDKAPIQLSASEEGPITQILHETSQGQYKQRNGLNGRNHLIAGQQLIAMLYDYWDDCYRARLATELRLERKNDLTKVIFGELRFLRRTITHNRGRAQRETVNGLEGGMLQQLGIVIQEGDEIALSESQNGKIVVAILETIDQIIIDAGGSDPNYRLATVMPLRTPVGGPRPNPRNHKTG